MAVVNRTMVTDKSTLLIPVLPRISCLKFTAHSANTESQCYTALTGLFIDPLTNKCNLIIIAIKTASYIIIYRLLNVILYFP